MKKIVLPFATLLLLATTTHAQTHILTPLWHNDSLKTPESVYYTPKCLYVSNINGAPIKKDGKGSIAKLNIDGSVIATEWITGLNAPKGIGKYKNTLYVADITDIVLIDIPSATITKRIAVDSAVFLNDVTVSKNGIVYVSDTRTGKIHQFKNGVVGTFAEKLAAPNGLLAVKDVLYVLDKGKLLVINPKHEITNLVIDMEASTDGIEMVKPGEFIVSAWIGVVYYVKADGSKEILLDTKAAKSNTADIGYNAKNKIVYVPTFYKNGVVAYLLK